MNNVIISILLVLVGLIVGIVIMFIANFIRKNSSNDKADKIIENARNEADKIKKDYIAEAKSEINELKLKTGDALELTLRKSGEIVMRKFEEPDLSIKKTEFGEEVLMNKKGEVLCIKQKITCEDMANALGMSFSRE